MPSPTSDVRILALDLATVTGWAVGDLVPPAPTPLEGACGAGEPSQFSGSKRLGAAHNSVVELATAFENWLADMVAVHKPNAIVFEAMLPVKAQSSRDSARVALVLNETLERFCQRRRIWNRKVWVSTLKKHATGSGRAKKPEMIKAARARGWNPKDDNEADALWLLDLARALMSAPKVA